MSKESSYMDDHNSEESQRVDDIKQSVLFSGELYMRNLFSDRMNKSMVLFQDSYWSKKFAVIRSGEFSNMISE